MAKLSAVTILETVVAMLIGTIVFFAAITVITDLRRTDVSGKKINALESINEYADRLQITPDRVPSSFSEQWNGFLIKVQISNYKSSRFLCLVDLSAFDENQTKITEQLRVLKVTP